MKIHTALALASLLGAAGCSEPTIGGPCQPFADNAHPGEACQQQFYFPAGIAIDPLADTLYVSNANADLRYAGGTVAAVDLNAFQCAIDFSRAGLPMRTEAAFPPACADDRFKYLVCAMRHAHGGFGDTRSLPSECQGTAVVGSGPVAIPVQLANDFPPANQARIGGDGLCRPDLLNSRIIECDEQLLITSAVRVGNFAGALRIRGGRPSPSNERCNQTAGGRCYCGPGNVLLCLDDTRRLFLADRGDPSITYIDVKHPAGAAATITCADPTPMGDLPPACTSQRITVRDFHSATGPTALPAGSPGSVVAGAPGADCAADPSKCVQLPGEPFGLALDQGYLPNECPDGTPCNRTDPCSDGTYCPADTTYERLLVSHLSSGEVTLINAGAARPASTPDNHPTGAVVLDVRGGFFNADTAGRRGSFSLAPRVPGDARTYWYVSSRVNPTVALFRLANANAILPAGTFNVSGGPFNVGDDIRDVAFDPCTPPSEPGCRAFFIENHPPSVFTVDTRIDPRRVPAGVPNNTVIDIVPLCQGPSHLAFRRLDDPRDLGAPQNRVFAVCFDAGQLAIVDPDISQLVDIVATGRGPNDVVFNFGPDIAVPPEHPHRARRAFVTNFLDMTVAVIDLDPGSANQDHVVARIGFTEPPTVH